MDLQSIIKVNIDFYNKNHVIINAKQYDKQSRYILFYCYNKNEFVRIDKSAYTAFVRYKKADGYGVFNVCTITDDGCVLVELTEQMLAADGLCCADLIIAKGRSLTFDPNNGSIIGGTNPNILSTMTFYVDVSETPIENSEIESSYDYSGFNKALEAVKDDISDVITIAKSYAVGDAGGRRPNENVDNAKYYYEQCRDKETAVSENASNAAKSETNAKAYMDAAKISEANAKAYRDNAYTYMDSAEGYMDEAKDSRNNASISESNAKAYMENAQTYKDSAYDYSVLAQRYAVGGTGTEEDEDIDNAKYYYEQCRDAIIGNAVIGIKGDNENDYRKGNVNITADNIGAIPSADIATVDEIKTYLGIS